jgi:hypothetical protein
MNSRHDVSVLFGRVESSGEPTFRDVLKRRDGPDAVPINREPKKFSLIDFELDIDIAS